MLLPLLNLLTLLLDVTEEVLEIEFAASLPDEVSFHLQTEHDEASPRTTKSTDYAEHRLQTRNNSLNGKGVISIPNKTASIAEFSLNPGAERVIVVWYSPRREAGLPDAKVFHHNSSPK